MTLPSGGRPGLRDGIGLRIALAAFVTASVAVAIVALGVVAVGGEVFTQLMLQHGESAATAHAMFDASITAVLAFAMIAAIVAALALAALLSSRLARPLGEIGAAARRLAAGDYEARVPRQGPEEVASLADSFNQMAISLTEQERLRREFIANAAHELRTPLTNLKGYLEALRDGVIPADRGTFESLWEEAERLVRLAASLEALAEGDAATAPPRLVELDLVAAIQAAVELAAPGLDRNDLSLDLGLPERLDVRADPDILAQVLGNLLQNAVRYTPRGGRVAIRVELRPADVLVTVANTGDGIPPEDLPHVFERFYRVDKSRNRARGGAGIGLAIVRQLVEAIGGRVGVESVGGLTRFWFSLPT
ncbi:MAG: ATP-binding protein [Chloroflexota bacterium]|nr:ATP-binding protein [Chloroflexota bacterium]